MEHDVSSGGGSRSHHRVWLNQVNESVLVYLHASDASLA